MVAGALPASEADKLYQQGRRAERAGKIVQAYLLYSQAAALEPSNQMFWLRSEALRSRAARLAKVTPQTGTSVDLSTADDEPGAAEDVETADPKDLAEARKPLPPTELKALAGRRDFNLRGDSKSLFQQVALAWGLDVVFDGDYEPAKSVHFQMEHADYREALRALEAATGSFIVPLSPRLFLVAKDTQQKRNDVEPSVAVSVPVPEPTTNQDLAALITAVQQASGLQKVAWDTQKNVVVLRGPISKVVPARQLFEDLLFPRTQVEIDLQFMEVTRTAVTNIGLTIPNSFPLYALTKALGNVPAIPQTIARLAVFGGGNSLIGVGLADAALVANLSKSSGHVLLRTQIRSKEGVAATLHIGDKYPIMSAGYFGPASFQGPGAYTPPPSFNFEDLGLTLKATPRVHGMDEITLDLESEFKVLAGAAVNGIPIISNRQVKSTISLEPGEWAVVAGLMQTQEARTISGIAGLNRIPLLSLLTSTRTKEDDANTVLILLRPRLLSIPPEEMVTRTIRLGSENRPLTPL